MATPGFITSPRRTSSRRRGRIARVKRRRPSLKVSRTLPSWVVTASVKASSIDPSVSWLESMRRSPVWGCVSAAIRCTERAGGKTGKSPTVRGRLREDAERRRAMRGSRGEGKGVALFPTAPEHEGDGAQRQERQRARFRDGGLDAVDLAAGEVGDVEVAGGVLAEGGGELGGPDVGGQERVDVRDGGERVRRVEHPVVVVRRGGGGAGVEEEVL